MKNLVERFVSATDRECIEKAVAEVELKTSGEVVCMIASSSYSYPMADVIAGAALAFPLALILTHFLGGWMWVGTQNMYLFTGLFAIVFVLTRFIASRVPCFKRLFVSRREIDEEVEEAAITAFFRHGLYRTRDANGVLLFLSVFERKVWLLADKGIHEKVSESQWDDLVASITAGIRNGRGADAICKAIGEIGDLLTSHFPVKPDDTNELKNLIVEEEKP